MNQQNPKLDMTKEALNRIERDEESYNRRFDEEPVLSNDFLKFMERYGDVGTFNMGNTEELKKRYFAFRNQEAVIKGLKEVYKKTFEGQSNLTLDDSVFKSVEKFVHDNAISDPERIARLVDSIDSFTKNQSRMDSLHKEIQSHGDWDTVRENLEAQQKFLTKESNRWGIRWGWRNFMGTQLFYKGIAGSGTEGVHITRDSAPKLLKIVNERLDTHEKAQAKFEELKEQLEEAQIEILSSLEPLGEIRDIIRTKVRTKYEQFLAAVPGKKLDEVEKAHAEYAHTEAHGKELLDANYFDAKFEQDLTTTIKQKLSENMVNAVDDSFKDANQFKKLSETLGKLTLNRKNIGDVVEPEATDWMYDELGKIRDGLAILPEPDPATATTDPKYADNVKAYKDSIHEKNIKTMLLNAYISKRPQ